MSGKPLSLSELAALIKRAERTHELGPESWATKALRAAHDRIIGDAAAIEANLERALNAERERDEARLALLAEADNTYTDAKGTVWLRPTAWAYFAACYALARLKRRAMPPTVRVGSAEQADILPPGRYLLQHPGYGIRRAVHENGNWSIDGDKCCPPSWLVGALLCGPLSDLELLPPLEEWTPPVMPEPRPMGTVEQVRALPSGNYLVSDAYGGETAYKHVGGKAGSWWYEAGAREPAPARTIIGRTVRGPIPAPVAPPQDGGTPND